MQPTEQFTPVVSMIQQMRKQVYHYANTALIELYWQIGRYLSEQVANEGWGKAVVKSLAEYISKQDMEVDGFSAQNLWRMKQFYETYRDDPKLSPLVREISWTMFSRF